MVKWTELPEAVRERERVAPLLVVVDELTSLAQQEPVPKGLPKDDPLRIEAEAINAGKARCFALVNKIAREARSAGVHLIAATQRFAVSEIGPTAAPRYRIESHESGQNCPVLSVPTRSGDVGRLRTQVRRDWWVFDPPARRPGRRWRS